MNKKFLSAILFGALMVTATGTFVSCKDYDDDIKDLQGQIDKLATKEDMTSQIATLQAALTTAAKDASDAITKATAAEAAAKAANDAAAEAKAAADKAVAEAKAESIKAVQSELEALKKEVTEATESALADMRKEVAEATKKVEDIVGKIADMVTSVELVYSYNNQIDGEYNETYDPATGNKNGYLWDLTGYKGQWLGFSTAFELDNIFSEGITGAITFQKDTQVQTKQKFIIRVSPTNAVITPEMISLINSKGEDLSDLVEVTNVEKYDGLLTARAAANTGLWEVSCQLKEYDKDSFAAKVTDANNNPVVFAVAVNNTLSTASTRDVVSSYDLAMNWSKYTPASELCYFVNEKNVQQIRNRHDSAEDGTLAGYTEMEWNANGPAVAPIKTGAKQNVTTGDNRDRNLGFELYPVVQGEAFTISLINQGYKSYPSYKEWMQPSNIRAIYVTLDDKANAVESAPSEWNAWNSYTYTGLNTVIEATSTQITINKATAINDIIGFRVYAVNYDGTLVDPDGKAFYVSVGAQIEDTAYNTTWTWNANGSSEVSKAAVAEGVFDNSWMSKVSTVTIESDTVRFGYTYRDAITLNDIKYYKADKTTLVPVGAPTKDIKYVTINQASLLAPAYYYDDNKTYNATISYKNANGNVIKTITVTLKKELPTFPAAFQAKVNQLNAEGTLNAFMAPAATNPIDGSKDLKQSFNGLDGDANYTFIFKNAQKNASGELEDMTFDGTNSYVFTVANSFIDNKTSHAVTVSYNFGQISSEIALDATTNLPKDYEVEGGEFKNIIFSCLAEINTYAWATAPSFVYEQAEAYTKIANVKATNTRDGKYTATLDKLITAEKDNMIDLTGAEYHLYSQVAKDGAIKEGSEDEYFKVTRNTNYTNSTVTTAVDALVFTPSSKAQNPEATVYSTLVITAKDYFGHKVEIKIANVEVKKR